MKNHLLIATIFVFILNVYNCVSQKEITFNPFGNNEFLINSQSASRPKYASFDSFEFILKAEDGATTPIKMTIRAFSGASEELYTESRLVSTNVIISTNRPKLGTSSPMILIYLTAVEENIYTVVNPEIIVEFTPYPIISILDSQEQNMTARELAIRGKLIDSTTDGN